MLKNKNAPKLSPATQTLMKKALGSLSSKPSKAEKKLALHLAAAINAEDSALFNEHGFAKMIRLHWDMAKTHRHHTPKIKIYDKVRGDKHHHKTVIDIVSDDYAFLVDSVVAEINKNDLLIDLIVHPIVHVEYDKKSQFKSVSPVETKTSLKQSHIHVQIKETLSTEALKNLEEGLYTALEDVYFANRDWRIMLERLKEARNDLATAKSKASKKAITRYCDFLDYMHDNNFTLLAYREYKFTGKGDKRKSAVVKGKSLGLLADDFAPAFINDKAENLPRNLQDLRFNLEPVSVSKTNRLSTVHRRVPMDAVAVKTYDSKGNVNGEKLFLGLFTSVTYSRSVSSVPLLSDKVEDVMSMSGFLEGSHDRKALRHILEKYPRDALFQISKKKLFNTAVAILNLQERQRIALFSRRDPFGRYISCLIYVPRDRFGTELRRKMVAVLESELNGECTALSTSMDDSVFARIHCTIKVDMHNPPQFSNAKIEVQLQDIGQTWQEMISEALQSDCPPNPSPEDRQRVTDLTLKYGHAFPIAYAANYTAQSALFDIQKIEAVLETGKMQIDLYRPADCTDNQMRLKLYHAGEPVTLADVMPILDNMGLRSISELPFEVKPNGGETSVWVHDFLLETPKFEHAIVIKDVKHNFERAFTKTWYGRVENDGLNHLILSANTNWHEITIVRAYVRYLTQIRYPFSREYITVALTKHPKIIRALVDLFKAQFNPENGKNADTLAKKISNNIKNALKNVDSLDEDRILRIITTLIQSTMRTNYYIRKENGRGKTYLSLKISSKLVKEIPDPKPFMEIFVYSPRVEAIHLRGDKIARGGLRWSDRHEDFRTEVLGLMKAQMVKNAVIVPVGSKGGFVVKRPTHSREEFQAEGIECYKIFIRGLLDITDNRKGTKIIPPKDVVRRDGDDPYLVVAADKGTATFSDIANGLSQEYGFWLDDAFASGGSAGYDHKVMGITAKGAWESVKLHFRQLNHNTQNQEFEVIGVGDMGGDVFGNGMLLSKKIKLVGAFNHLHIFCDPNPDCASTYKERKRLFKAVKGWDHYNQDLLSEGGRIFSRADKKLKLTPQIKAAFDLDKDEVSPSELMHAMLKARTDLLWFGGIGTYIKASSESDEDAGDKANDAIRVNGNELRASVIGEGANLGLTQLGRIEFAAHGGRLNTDFIDNSGGVDSSDHEVNIKILLSDVMSQKGSKMDIAARNVLLESMTDEVGDLVLRNNYQQGQALSLIELEARENLQAHEELIQEMERDHGLDRRLEGLPSKEEIESRLRAGKGMTRPELCILLAYSKIRITQDLLHSSLPDEQEIEEWILGYFPKVLQEKYKTEIFRHRLAREIMSTTMANSLVNRMGPTFVKQQMKKTGARLEDVAKAYTIVRDMFGLREMWDQIEALDNKVPAEIQLRAMLDIAKLSQHVVSWFLRRNMDSLDGGLDIKTYRNSIKTLTSKMDSALTKDLKAEVKQRVDSAVRDGLPEKLARHIALLPVLVSSCDIIRISLEQKQDLLLTAKTYFALGEYFNMGWLRSQARYMQSEDRWQTEAIGGLLDKLYTTQAGMTVKVLSDAKRAKVKGSAPFKVWLEKNVHIEQQFNPFFADLRRHGAVDLPMIVVAEQRLSQLYNA